ncbi:MAG: phosphate ABC transporter substrate-binding protein PstS, partial [Acidimicrobiales bacterium]
MATGAVLSASLVAAACGSTSNLGTSGTNTTPLAQAAFSNQICGQNASSKPNFGNGISTVPGQAASLSGAGSTFVAPVMSVWAQNYSQSKGVQVAYQAVGSGAGVQQIQAQTIDFGDSDVPMTSSELAAAKGGVVLHIPVVIGAAAPTYNLPGIKAGLKFTGDVLGRIFAGRITTWNDPAITSLNPSAHLPSMPIAVVHRSDGSG